MPSLSIVITSYNEEKILPKTVETTLAALNGLDLDYEIIIIDDTSRDRSFEVAQELASRNPKIKVFRNEKNMNQGRCFLKSIGLATKEYHCVLAGDDMVEPASLREFFAATGKADIILNAPQNQDIRHPFRRFLSAAYVRMVNILFGLKIKYYNGPVIIKTELLKNIHISGAFSFISETVVQLLKRGTTYYVVPIKFKADEKGANVKAVKRNFFPVLKGIVALWWRIRVLRRV